MRLGALILCGLWFLCGLAFCSLAARELAAYSFAVVSVIGTLVELLYGLLCLVAVYLALKRNRLGRGLLAATSTLSLLYVAAYFLLGGSRDTPYLVPWIAGFAALSIATYPMLGRIGAHTT